MGSHSYSKQIDDLRYNLDKAESNIDILVNAKDYTINKLGDENIDLQRENKELKAKVAYLELNKEGIEQKDDILFKQNKDLREKIVYLQKKIFNYEYGKNAIDVQEKNELIKQNEGLKEIIENLKGKLISKSNLLSEQKEENKHLKNTLKLSKNTILELKDSYEKERNKNYKTLESEELKQENKKLKNKVDEYYNKFLSEGTKKEKAQQLIREIKKEIYSQDFDHEGFYSLQNMYHRIENILKER